MEKIEKIHKEYEKFKLFINKYNWKKINSLLGEMAKRGLRQ